MDADKQKALEAAGWKFGSADDFLGERPMSDSDKMRAEFEQWAESKCMSLTRIHWASGSLSDYAYTATFDAWKVWQAAYQAGRKAEREEVESESFETARRCSVCGDWFSSSSQTLHPCPHCKTKPEGER